MSMTRRDFVASSAVLAATGFLSPVARVLAQAPQPTPVFTPIRRNVGFFTMQGGTVGYLIDPNGVVVVDSQFPASAKVLLEGLNERSKSRPVDFLINTHHHGDHTGGNIVFKGSAKKVVSHETCGAHMKTPPGKNPPGENLFPDTTFKDQWRQDVGDERIRARFYGPAHTSGDAVITFERANVAHMGDLMFNKRHPLVDRPAGARISGWIGVLEKVPGDHSTDTTYIFGHANTGLPVIGTRADLMDFRNYLSAVLTFVESQIKAGKTRDEIIAMRDPLKGFEAYGQFPAPSATSILQVAYEELTTK